MTIFVVYGECENADYNSPNYTPILGYFEGDKNIVQEYAETLSRWKTYGQGGKIEEIRVQKIDQDTLNKRRDLLIKKQQLTINLEEVTSKLSEDIGNISSEINSIDEKLK